MIEFLRKLLGISKPPGPNLPESRATSNLASSASEQTVYQGEKRERPVSRNGKSPSGRAATDEYFQLSAVIETSRAAGDSPAAIQAARKTFPLMPAVVRQMKKEFGG